MDGSGAAERSPPPSEAAAIASFAPEPAVSEAADRNSTVTLGSATDHHAGEDHAPPFGPPSNTAVPLANVGEAVQQEEEEEEEEPRLKYRRLGSDVNSILSSARATCLAVSDKLLALGTSAGTVHVLDYEGNQVNRFSDHSGAVTDLSFDGEVEWMASSSEDASVVVRGLYEESVQRLPLRKAIASVAIDPRYGQRKSQEVVAGGAAGQLVLTSRGWLGAKTTVLASGEGPVSAVRWAGSCVAWANNVGVKVYDMATHTRIAYVERPAECVAAGGRDDAGEPCSLYWQDAALLYIAWGQTVTVLRVVAGTGPSLTTATGTSYTASYQSMATVATLQSERALLGIAPFGQDIVLLAAANDAAAAPPAPAAPPLPELRICSWTGTQVSVDALPLHGYEAGPGGCRLYAHHPHRHPSLGVADWAPRAGGKFEEWWRGVDEPIYFIVTPEDVVVSRPRDSTDRIAWLLEQRRYKQALEVAEADVTVKPAVFDKVADAYLHQLLAEGRYAEAAALTPRLLQANAASWERWVYLFAQLRQLPLLAPHLPTGGPGPGGCTLRPTAYNMVLTSFLPDPGHHGRLLETLRAWPMGVYDVGSITDAVLQRMRAPGGDSLPLLHAAAHLCSLQGKAALALTIHLRLRDPGVFEFIRQHSLLPSLHSHVRELMDVDAAKATELLVQHWEDVPPSAVVPEIMACMSQAQAAGNVGQQAVWRERLHRYLDALFVRDVTAASEYHSMQVELYADFAPRQLMSFLQGSQQYSLERALQVAEARGLVQEQVYILGRMGAAPTALRLIINQMQDIAQAIEFVVAQGDEELWELLIQLTIGNAQLTGKLLDHIGGYVNPLRLVRQIPDGMEIEGLRDRLVRIIADFRTHTSLREGCNTILQHDCITLQRRFYREIQRALRSLFVGRPAPPPCGRSAPRADAPPAIEWRHLDCLTGREGAVGVRDLPGPLGAKQLHIRPKSSGGGGREQGAGAPNGGNKVWVGITADAPPAGGPGGAAARWRTPAPSKWRRRYGKKEADGKPDLPSLVHYNGSHHMAVQG